jgi:hypothetical protein
MSKEWIEETILRMEKNTDKAIQDSAKILQQYMGKIKLRGNLLDNNGNQTILDLGSY